MDTAAPQKAFLEQEPFDVAAIEAARKAVETGADQRKKLREEVDALLERLPKTKAEAGKDDALKAAVGCWLTGRHADAAEWFAVCKDGKERRWYAAVSAREAGDNAKAVADFERAAARGWDAVAADVAIVETRRLAGELEESEKVLKRVKGGESSADWQYERALQLQRAGDYENCIDAYVAALKLNPNHRMAAFNLARLYDQRGEEDEAINLYKQCVAVPPTYVNALINLAVVCEDQGRFDEAVACLDQVLRAYPDHPRAVMYRKDAMDSVTMQYDEDAERDRTARNQVLEIPITDFELSVRSRNCLRKMNIRTLGDLLHISETELLSYKNFGETSLNEIKEMLDSKNLRLGLALDEAETAPRPRPKAAAPAGAAEGILNIPVTEIEFSVRSKKCLQRLGVTTLGDLTQRSEPELLAVKNFGQTSLQEIKNKLTEYNLSLKQVDK